MIMRRFVLNSESVRWCERRWTAFLTVVMSVALTAAGAHADMLSVRIANGNDDSEEHLNEGNSIDIGSSDLEIGAEDGEGDAQLIGLRFLNIGIPRNATINSANIQFTVDETDDEVQTIPIQIFGGAGGSFAIRHAGA